MKKLALILILTLAILPACNFQEVQQVADDADEALADLEAAVEDLREKNEELKVAVEGYKERASDISAAIRNWTQFRNASQGYMVEHPADWQVFPESAVVGFGPPDRGDYQWAIFAYDINSTTINSIINTVGDQFLPDRNESREEFELNGHQAILVTVTTSRQPEWVAREVFIRAPERSRLYRLTNGGIETPDFQEFYESFELL